MARGDNFSDENYVWDDSVRTGDASRELRTSDAALLGSKAVTRDQITPPAENAVYERRVAQAGVAARAIDGVRPIEGSPNAVRAHYGNLGASDLLGVPSHLGVTGRDSVIGSRSRIRGTLQFEGRVLIDGTVDGEVLVEGDLIIGRSGVVTGNVTAESIRIEGRLKGDAHGEKRVELVAGANVAGDLHCSRIVIQDGVGFEGACFMGDAHLD